METETRQAPECGNATTVAQLKPADRWAAMTTPTLIIDGGKSPAWIRNAAKAFKAAIPNAQSRTIPGQTHMVKPDALAPVLIEYFST